MSIGLLSPIFIFIGWSPNASPNTDPKKIGNCVMLGPMASSGVHAPDCLVAFCVGFAKLNWETIQNNLNFWNSLETLLLFSDRKIIP